MEYVILKEPYSIRILSPKFGCLPDPVIQRLAARRQWLQYEHLAALLRPDGDAVRDR